MELRQLKYFVSAAKHLNFTKAAEECCIVQSAMSQQMTALERELGAPLFRRTNRGLRLTPEGEIMAREARQLLAHAQEVQRSVQHSRDDYRDALRIGCCESLLYRELPRALSKFREQYPRTRVQLRGGQADALLSEVERGSLDCLITLAEGRFEGLEWARTQTLAEEAVYAMLPKDSPLAREERLFARQLSNEALILYAGDGETEVLRRQVTLAQAMVHALTTSRESAEALVAAGYGISFCPRSAARPREGVTYREMADFPRGRTCLLWREGCEAQARVDALSSLLQMVQTE